MKNETDAAESGAHGLKAHKKQPASLKEQTLAAALRRNLQRRKTNGAKRADTSPD